MCLLLAHLHCIIFTSLHVAGFVGWEGEPDHLPYMLQGLLDERESLSTSLTCCRVCWMRGRAWPPTLHVSGFAGWEGEPDHLPYMLQGLLDDRESLATFHTCCRVCWMRGRACPPSLHVAGFVGWEVEPDHLPYILQGLLDERESLTTSLDMSVGKIQELERKQREHEGIIRYKFITGAWWHYRIVLRAR